MRKKVENLPPEAVRKLYGSVDCFEEALVKVVGRLQSAARILPDATEAQYGIADFTASRTVNCGMNDDSTVRSLEEYIVCSIGSQKEAEAPQYTVDAFIAGGDGNVYEVAGSSEHISVATLAAGGMKLYGATELDKSRVTYEVSQGVVGYDPGGVRATLGCDQLVYDKAGILLARERVECDSSLFPVDDERRHLDAAAEAVGHMTTLLGRVAFKGQALPNWGEDTHERLFGRRPYVIESREGTVMWSARVVI